MTTGPNCSDPLEPEVALRCVHHPLDGELRGVTTELVQDLQPQQTHTFLVVLVTITHINSLRTEP